MLVTAPPIGRLCGRPRLWACIQIKAGRFGPVIRRRGRAYQVELANVEAALGVRFSPAQLAAAGITIQPEQEAA